MKEIRLTPEIDKRRFDRWFKQSKPFIYKLFRDHIKIDIRKSFGDVYVCETRIRDTDEVVNLKVLNGPKPFKTNDTNRCVYTNAISSDSIQNNNTPWWEAFHNTRTITHL